MSKYKTLLFDLVVFLAIQLLGLYVSYKTFSKHPEVLTLPEISVWSFVLSFAIALLFIFVAMRFLKHKFGFKAFFVFLVFVGSNAVFSPFLSNTFSIILAVVLALIWILFQYVLVHNLVIALTIAGISAELGFSMSVPTALILISALSIYDVLAVYRTKHMVSMFNNLMNKGVVLSVIIPRTLRGFLSKTKTAVPGKGYMFLGTGDLAFPLILAVAVLKTSILSALFVVAGALVGASVVFYLLVNQLQRRAIPALPPIAVCSVLGFIIGLLI